VIDFLPAMHGSDPELVKYREFLAKSNLMDLDLSKINISGNYSQKPDDFHRTPYDLGWGRLVNFDHDFIGHAALASMADNQPNIFVALEWNSEDVIDVFASLFRAESFDYMEMPRASALRGDGVYVDGNLVGCAMSRCYSYWFKKMISHGVVLAQHSEPGTEVEVKWGSANRRQRMIRAVRNLPCNHSDLALLKRHRLSKRLPTKKIDADCHEQRLNATPPRITVSGRTA
jgi:glycine cleavage system aminomethyltransferase T